MRQVTKDSTKKYITSERFIHEDLISDGKMLVRKLYEIWGRDNKIRPSVILFPAEYIRDDRGKMINGVVAMELDNEPDHGKAIEQAIERTRAYAFFYVVTIGSTVRALLESPHGTALWEIPIVRSGDRNILKDINERFPKRDALGLGFLWSKNQGNS